MSTNKADRIEWGLIAGTVVVVLWLLGSVSWAIVGSYDNTRRMGIKEYQQALEANLETPYTKNLNQIRGALGRWMVGYGELNVPTSYTNVYKQVESTLAEANTLSERFPTMLAPDFERNLGSLRRKVAAIPQISSTLYSERNPWLSGLALFVLFGTLKAVGMLLVFGLIIGGAIVLGLKAGSSTATTSTPSSSSSTSSGGGGSYGGMGGYGGPIGYNGPYGEGWNYPPPTYRPPPF